MPANPFNNFTDYGIGIGLRVPHYQHILSRKPVVDWFEIISENFMVDGGRPLHVLDQILEQYRVVQHGVSMYFGYSFRLRCAACARISACWISRNTAALRVSYSDRVTSAIVLASAISASCLRLFSHGRFIVTSALYVLRVIEPTGITMYPAATVKSGL